METDIYTRQNRIFEPSKQRLDITIIGAGSTGSFIALTLAKMGMNKIKVIDFDEIEVHNIPNQFYNLDDVGTLKVNALQNIIKGFTGVKIQAENKFIKEDYEFDLNSNSLIILCVDNMESRELIYEKIKDYPIKLIDTRMGGEGFSIQSVDLSEDEEKEDYEKSLGLEIKETSCGEKAIIYTILSIAAETCNIVKMMDKNENFPKVIKREMKTYRFIEKK